jgi:hypothetical protein
MRNDKGKPGHARPGAGRKKISADLQKKIFKFYLYFPEKPLIFIGAAYGVSQSVVSKAVTLGLQRKL